MVNKKAAVVVSTVAALGIAVWALRRAEAPPAVEVAPEGEVSIEITPPGMPKGFSFEDVLGQEWGVGATINVSGVCTAGYPVPTMVLELYDNGVLRKTLTPPSVVIGTIYTLSDTMGVADVGAHTVYGRMVLTNPLGSYEFITPTQSFSIGEAPPGEVTLEVILTPA